MEGRSEEVENVDVSGRATSEETTEDSFIVEPALLGGIRFPGTRGMDNGCEKEMSDGENSGVVVEGNGR